MDSSKLADHVVLAVKDEMRGVRYRVNTGIRRSRELATARGPLMILEPVASVADVVMSGVEAAASALLAAVKTVVFAARLSASHRELFRAAPGRKRKMRTSSAWSLTARCAACCAASALRRI